MALSQIQCLDDNHVNWRVSESKPEFLYSEDQRLALESLISGGREAFDAYVKERELRPFLSEPEIERLSRSVVDYRPGSTEQHTDPAPADAQERALSLQYWPDRSDVSVPELDLGWPDCNSYRGVTRVNVHTQPPVDGQTHIKEVVRKTIAQAQKLIALVMDAFTDVDIFKDLLDAGFKRKVAVYIVIEQASVQDFLHMCDRAGMHGGHLKYLRVRCCGGSEFHTRSAKKLQGALSQKFMFVDGDRAVSGSYSFTWTASRLDRNLIMVLTGQAVETFDKQFRELYFSSRSVNLSKIRLAIVPEPEPLPVPAPASLPSAAVARKLINPKYALVETASRASSDKAPSPKDSTQTPLPQPVKRHREAIELPPKHPGLIGLPKAELIPYLPIWPEPDPPSDVIGFINIRDTSKPLQPHMSTRSQLFETSQAIRFKDPFVAPPEEPLPEKACPRLRASHPSKTTLPDIHIEPADKPDGKVPTKVPNAPADTVNPVNSVSPPKPAQPLQDKAPPQERPPGPPVPKPRTLKLVVSAGDSPENMQVSLVKRTEMKPHETSNSEEYAEAPEHLNAMSGTQDSGSKPEGDDRDSNRTPELAHSPQDEGSTASDEYYECNDPDHSRLTNGGPLAPGRHGEDSAVNIMARFSQSMLDLRPDKSADLDPTNRNLLNVQSRYAGKVYQPFEISSTRETYSRAKVVIAKPGVYHRPPKSNTRVIGGHRYWQGKLGTTQTGHDPGRLSRSPCRKMPPAGLKTSQSPTQRVSHTHSPSPRRNETPMPLGINISKLSSLRNLRGRVPAVTGEKKVVHRHKE